MKKPLKKSAIKKSVKAAPKKPIKKSAIKKSAIEKNPLIDRLAALEADLKAAQADTRAATKNIGRLELNLTAALRKRQDEGQLSERIVVLRGLLVKACEHALDVADNIADERIVEAEEDFYFRNDIDTIRVTADISLREREPKAKLDDAGEEYIWIGDEEAGDNGEAASVAAPVAPVVEQRADHGGGMSGHDQDDDEGGDVGEVDAVPPAVLPDGSVLAPIAHEPTTRGNAA